jgi:hypothetical protein
LISDLPICAKYFGPTYAASKPMITITTSSSSKVNPRGRQAGIMAGDPSGV